MKAPILLQPFFSSSKGKHFVLVYFHPVSTSSQQEFMFIHKLLEIF
jgi:hypothetical protein